MSTRGSLLTQDISSILDTFVTTGSLETQDTERKTR